MKKAKRQYITISEIQDEYLPISKKKIRILVRKYLPTRMLGNRIFVDREKLEELPKRMGRDWIWTDNS